MGNGLHSKIPHLILGLALVASCSSNKTANDVEDCRNFVRRINTQASIEGWNYDRAFPDVDRSCSFRKPETGKNAERKSMEERNREYFCGRTPGSREELEKYYKICRNH